MALTTAEETRLKKLVAEEIKQDAIDDINSTALSEIKIKQNEISAIDIKRNSDIEALKK